MRAEAIVLVRMGMNCSSYIQNRCINSIIVHNVLKVTYETNCDSVLNSWISLASDLSTTQHTNETSNSIQDMYVIEITERDVELRSTIGKKSVKLHSVLLWTR